MKPQAKTENQTFERTQPPVATGLSQAEAETRIQAGAHNQMPQGITPTVGKIILKNVCTLFNLINFLLALAILLMGHPRNVLFFGVAICNTLMGIVQELRAKRTLDKLSILARGKAEVVRDGQKVAIPQQEVVLDDILRITAGNQVCADGVVAEGQGLEVDESLLTGEADPIRKGVGERVLSGSVVVAGQASVRVDAVGASSYAGTLSVRAKAEKKAKTPLMRTLNNIIRVLAIAIIPVGALLFYTQYTGSGNLTASVLGASAAMLGMIPEGLILLTGVTLTVGALKLARRKALVQTLPSIETLARVDVLCLDKTGTITDGTLSFEEFVPMNDVEPEEATGALREMLAALRDENSTATALRQAFPGGGQWEAGETVPFSSARKWSAASFPQRGSYVMGAPAFVFPGDALLAELVKPYAARGHRVLCLAHSGEALPAEGLPPALSCMGLLVLTDTVRPEAAETFHFFAKEGVTLKVISGDDALTASTIAGKAGIADADEYVDMNTLGDDINYPFVAERYTVFGRVTPEQKRELVAALKANDHTVCMTGDGVNDVLAMKEADCGVAMIGGSDAARGAADFVLMTSDFSAMVDVLREGRRVINNIENVASMYLVKTIYSAILSLLYVFIPYPYPFTPLQMTPFNTLTVGIPSFFLALRENYGRPKGRFAVNILENSAPAALTVVFNILVVQLAGVLFGLTQLETATMNVLLTGGVGFCVLRNVAKPFRVQEKLLLALCMAGFLLTFVLLGDFFTLGSLVSRNIFFYAPLLYISTKMLPFLQGIVAHIETWWENRQPRARVE